MAIEDTYFVIRRRLVIHAATAAAAAALVGLLLAPPQIVEAAPLSCDQIKALQLPNTTVTAAQLVAAGAFRPPSAGRDDDDADGAVPAAYTPLPAFCRVQATLAPTPDSDIKIE